MKKILLPLLLTLQLVTAQNEVNFYRNYYVSDLNSHSLNGFRVIAKKIIEDKITTGYFVIGREDLTGGQNNQTHNVVFVAKLNSAGECLWVKTEGSTDYEYCDIEQMQNGQLLFADGMAYFPHLGYYGKGFKIIVADNSYSSVVWARNYSNNSYASCRAITESFDVSTNLPDGVMGCGTTDLFNGAFMCVKANRTNGSIIWSKSYRFGGTNEGANDICQTEDGGYVVTGFSDQYLVLFKVDVNGNLLWSQKTDIIAGSNAAGVTLLNVPDGAGYSILVGANVSGNVNKALVLKRDASGVLNASISGVTNGTTAIHSMQMRNANALMISGEIRNSVSSSQKTYISTLNLSNIATTIMAMEFDISESRSTVVTADNSFISTGSTFDYLNTVYKTFYAFKTKSDGLVNCLGTESVFPMNPQVFTNINHSVTVITNTFIASFFPSPNLLKKETSLICCYTANAIVLTIPVHVSCHDSVSLVANCEGESVKWFDERDSLIAGETTNFLSFVASHSTVRTARKYTASGCVVCEKRFEVIVDPPQVCFTLPETICLNQPITPQLTCNMSKVNWHRWVVTELNGAWENRVVKGQFPSSGPPSAVNIKDLWKGFIPGKCYGISLDVQDSCGNSNTLYQFFCIPAIEEDTLNLTMCPLNGNSSRWFEPSPHCSGAYYTFLGNDSRDYPYGYPLSPGSYALDCMDANGCEIKRLTVQVAPLTPLPATDCFETIYYCGPMPNPEDTLPHCENCYRQDPRVEVFPLELETINGAIRYKRKIIDRDNCRQCNFSFELVDKACDFTIMFAFFASPQHPENITLLNSSSSGPETMPCGNSWSIQDLSMPTSTIFLGSPLNFNGTIGHTYQVCLTVTNCACGKECVKTICTTMFVGEEGPLRLSSGGGSEQLASPAVNETKLLTEIAVKPNPSSGKFTLLNSSGINTYDRVVLMSASGQTLLQIENIPATHEYEMTDLAKGIYTIKVMTGREVKVMKLIIQ